jgi:PKD repeat protein
MRPTFLWPILLNPIALIGSIILEGILHCRWLTSPKFVLSILLAIGILNPTWAIPTVTINPVEPVEFDVTQVMVTGTATAVGGGQGIDLILVLDDSGSLDNTDPDGQRFDAVRGLLTNIASNPNVNIGLVFFTDSPSLEVPLGPLSTVTEPIHAELNARQDRGPSGGTEINDGINAAATEFSNNGRPDASYVILLFTDGESDLYQAVNAAENAKAQGITVNVVNLGLDEQGSQNNKKIAEKGGGQFSSTTDAIELSTLFSSGGIVGMTDTITITNKTTNQQTQVNLSAGVFSVSVDLVRGENVIEVTATDLNGVLKSETITAIRKRQFTITVTPDNATNVAGTTHTITAIVTDEDGNRVPQRELSFDVTQGPNANVSATTRTDDNGTALFTYPLGDCAGIDQIQAQLFDSTQPEPFFSNSVFSTIQPSAPTANFTATLNSDYVPSTVNLDGFSSKSACNTESIVDYQWQSSDGQSIAPGVNSSITYTQQGDYQITLTVTDNLGGTHSTQQFVEVLISNQDALMAFLQGLGAEPISIDSRSISVVIAGETHRGLLAEQVTQGTSLSNNLIIEPIGDLNNDGNEDVLITYPSGDQQILYDFGTGSEPSQEALKRYFESFGSEAIVINADNSVSLTLNGKTYRGQLADEIVAGTPSGFLSLILIDDSNPNGVDEYEVIYPTGERQKLSYFGEPPITLPTPSQLSTTEISTPASMTEFLYTGDDPIQTEVEEGTIDPDKLAVLRGRVTNRNGQPLSEVTITLLNRPEFGQTRTLSNGVFSLAVNGGEFFTIKYTKAGYLSAQRQVNTETQGFFWAADVVLTPIERPQGPTVDLSVTNTEPMQVVQGPEVTSTVKLNPDLNRPPRQATIFFPQDTTATLADGTQLDELDVSITEYTVDDNDLAAMPAPLPSGSGYTYAVNISVNGRTDVQLSKPIPFYLNNFLGFPTGTTVPVGRLDDTNQSRWDPAADGRVIKILSIDEGLATLDTNGDGLADNELGITEAERREIAKQFPLDGTRRTVRAGEDGDFWRVVINKLGNFDLNWPLKTLEKLSVKMGEIANTASKLLPKPVNWIGSLPPKG